MQQRKIKIHEFNNDLYPRKIWVVYDKDAREAICKKFLTQEGNIIMFDPSRMNTLDAITMAVVDAKTLELGYLMWFMRQWDESVIAHEVQHSVISIADDIGMEINEETQEPVAYLNGWITKCVYKVKKGVKNDRKKAQNSKKIGKVASN